MLPESSEVRISDLPQVKDLLRDHPPIYRQPPAGLGRLRKIALVGSAPSIKHTPWYDPTWEIWAHATVHPLCVRADRYFDLHPWEWIVGKQVKGYVPWLRRLQTPIYMQKHFTEVPASIKYPLSRILAEFPDYFTGHPAFMIALALTEGVTHLGIFGVHYAHDSEYKLQRPGLEFWLGVAYGRGVQLVNPPECPVLREPKERYGYESHIGKQHPRQKTGGIKPGQPGPVTKIIAEAEMSVQAISEQSRQDVPQHKERLAAQLAGTAPIDPRTGKPAW